MDNPKEKIGSKKVPLAYLPPAGIIYGGLAMADGAAKYLPYNFRDSKVSYMTYLHAILRHTLALIDGEDVAEDSQLPHLAHIIANGAILADATEGDFIVDDRPPKGPAAKILKKFDKSKSTADPDNSADPWSPLGSNKNQAKQGILDKQTGFGSWSGGTLIGTTDIDSPRPYYKVHPIDKVQVPEMTEDTLL